MSEPSCESCVHSSKDDNHLFFKLTERHFWCKEHQIIAFKEGDCEQHKPKGENDE